MLKRTGGFEHFCLFANKELPFEAAARPAPEPSSAPQIRGDIYQETKLKMREKMQVIREWLVQQSKKGERVIVVGCEDFFESAYAYADTCFDMKAAYEMMTGAFVELSKEFPEAIICPGSFYISTPIPKLHGNIRFDQDGATRKLSDTVCYTANIMPVYHGGELLRVIHKGEKVIRKIPVSKNNVRQEAIDSAEDITANSPSNNGSPAKIFVPSYHEDNLTDLHIAAEAGSPERSSTCFLGKTFLPGEMDLIKKLLPQFKDPNVLLDHAFTIDGEHFCVLICGEFNYKASTSGKLLLEHQFDYCIHSTVGGDIFEEMKENCRVYLHSDFGGLTKVLCENAEIDPDNITDQPGDVVVRDYRAGM